MNTNHIFIQFKRLERHYHESLKQKDVISFLDLSHCLRIWVDMKTHIDTLAEAKGIQLKLTNTTTQKSIKKILRGSKYTYLPLGSGVESPGVEVKGVRIINKTLSPEEIKKLYEAGPPIAQSTKLRFSEWIASGIYEVPSKDEAHPQIRITREILIKRVANILGASHPIGTEEGDERENKFDPYILELHNISLADGYPATYYQLLEIADDILIATQGLFENRA